MSGARMHDDEVETSAALVRRLLAAQFPQWADLPIEPVAAGGTDNALYRLGDELSVRLPRIASATGQIEVEREWLPRLAPLLPLAIPGPLATGAPGEGYPWPWAICRWLPGENAASQRPTNLHQAARDLANFIAALERTPTSGWPDPGPPTSFRSEPLATRDADVRECLASLRGMLDTEAALAAWEVSLNAPEWPGPPVWIHADLQPLNLLVDRGRISAVIDFGGLGLGDPAVDLMVAWHLLSADARETFRAALPPGIADDATWARGRGWALSMALIALPYYLHTNPAIVGVSRHTIAEVLAYHASGA